MPALAKLLTFLLALVTDGGAWPTETAVLHEINRARTEPSAYAADLRRTAQRYDPAGIEPPAGLRETATVLAGQAPLPPLLPDPVLQAAARDHVEAQGREGGTGHIGRAGDTPGERVRRYGGDIYVAEVIAYDMTTAIDVVRHLLVDNHVAGAGHRRLLLTPFYRYAGAWCGPHPTLGTICVVDLAAGPGGRPHVPAQ